MAVLAHELSYSKSSDSGPNKARLSLVVRRQSQKTGSLLGCNIHTMKVATGTVIDGKVLVDGETLAEGSTVTVLLRDDDETFVLKVEEEAELLVSIAAIERGEYISGEQLLERLRRFG